MNTAQVFDILDAEQPPEGEDGSGGGGGGGGGGGSGGGTGIDEGEGEEKDGSPETTDAGFDEHDWEGADSISEEEGKVLWPQVR